MKLLKNLFVFGLVIYTLGICMILLFTYNIYLHYNPKRIEVKDEPKPDYIEVLIEKPKKVVVSDSPKIENKKPVVIIKKPSVTVDTTKKIDTVFSKG